MYTYLTNIQTPVDSNALLIPFHEATILYFCLAVIGILGSAAAALPPAAAAADEGPAPSAAALLSLGFLPAPPPPPSSSFDPAQPMFSDLDRLDEDATAKLSNLNLPIKPERVRGTKPPGGGAHLPRGKVKSS